MEIVSFHPETPDEKLLVYGSERGDLGEKTPFPDGNLILCMYSIIPPP